MKNTPSSDKLVDRVIYETLAIKEENIKKQLDLSYLFYNISLRHLLYIILEIYIAKKLCIIIHV